MSANSSHPKTNLASTTAVNGVTGTLPIASGGTGGTTKAAAFDALSPMTSVGDIIYGGASGTGLRLTGGTTGQVLTAVTGSAPAWTATPVTVPSQIIRGTCASFGGSTSGETAVVNYSAAISSTGSDITFTARTTTTGDKYTINTTGIYAIWATGNDGTPGDSYGITVNSSGLSTAVQSLSASQVPMMSYSSTGSNTFVLGCTINLNANDIVRVQGEPGKSVTGNSNTRFGITRVA